jgi:hypothetical protein
MISFARWHGPSRNPPFAPLFQRGAVKKLIWFFLASFRRKLESRFFTDLRIDWTPVFTGVTNEFQFFHSFRGVGGISEAGFQSQFFFESMRFLQVRKIGKLV